MVPWRHCLWFCFAKALLTLQDVRGTELSGFRFDCPKPCPMQVLLAFNTEVYIWKKNIPWFLAYRKYCLFMRTIKIPSTQSAVHFHLIWCNFESYSANCCASFSQTFICPGLYVTIGKIEINIVKTNISGILFFLLLSFVIHAVTFSKLTLLCFTL